MVLVGVHHVQNSHVAVLRIEVKTTREWPIQRISILGVGGLAGDRRQANQVNSAAVSIQDAEAVGADFSDFIAFWQVPERTHDQAADGVEFIVGEVTVEELVEVFDRGRGFDQEVAAGQRRM